MKNLIINLFNEFQYSFDSGSKLIERKFKLFLKLFSWTKNFSYFSFSFNDNLLFMFEFNLNWFDNNKNIKNKKSFLLKIDINFLFFI